MEDKESLPGVNEPESQKAQGSFWDIFLEPTKCFEGLNARPKFIIPLILCILMTFASTFVMHSKIDMAQAAREQIAASRAADQLSEEQIDEQVQLGLKIGKISAFVAPFIVVPLMVLLLSGLIMLGVFTTGSEVHGKSYQRIENRSCGSCGGKVPLSSKIGDKCPHCAVVWGADNKLLDGTPASTGESSAFTRVFAVTTCSMFFYNVVAGVLTIAVILTASDPNSLNISNLVFTNPAGLVDFKESRVLYSFLSRLDVLVWYTIYLLGLGISKITTKCSVTKGVIIIGFWYVLYALARIGMSALF